MNAVVDPDARFSAPAFFEAAANCGTTLGASLHALGTTTSTNDVASALSREDVPHGTLVVADQQTAGRGQRGRTWHSSALGSLTFSLLLRPTLSAARAQRLPLVVGVALVDTFAAELSVPVQVKWPNDVLAGGKKLAGVLAETQFSGSTLRSVVVGVGVNLTLEHAPDEIRALAVGLSEAGAAAAAREVWCARILARIEHWVTVYETHGLDPIVERLRDCDATRGRRVRLAELAGVGAGIDNTGAFLLRDDHGQVHAITSGSLELGTTA